MRRLHSYTGFSTQERHQHTLSTIQFSTSRRSLHHYSPQHMHSETSTGKLVRACFTTRQGMFLNKIIIILCTFIAPSTKDLKALNKELIQPSLLPFEAGQYHFHFMDGETKEPEKLSDLPKATHLLTELRSTCWFSALCLQYMIVLPPNKSRAS